MSDFSPTLEQIKTIVTEVLDHPDKGAWFDKPYDLNFGSIRNDLEEKADYDGNDDETLILHANLFNDWSYLAWKDGAGKQHLQVWGATTDPGWTWRKAPGRGVDSDGKVRGVGAIREGYYKLVYQLGTHGGRPALENKDKPFLVYRDNDCNTILTLDPSTTQKGWGFNYHFMGGVSSKGIEASQVNRWSGGCNGPYDPKYLDLLIQMVKLQDAAGLGNQVSYAMLRRSWFDISAEEAREEFRQICGLPAVEE